MTDLDILEKRLIKLLKFQNPDTLVYFESNIPFDSFVEINIKSPNMFLQIDELDLIMENLNFTLIKFIMEHHSTLNIQSFNSMYSIKLSNDCLTHSFFLKKIGEVNIELGDFCKCIYKGNHSIKTAKKCIIENALKQS